MPSGAMIPWERLDRHVVPGSRDGELTLHRRGAELSIRIDGQELMNSRLHASEDALGALTAARVAERSVPRLLVGGLGMGFTLAAALAELEPGASVQVVELVPAVVSWNREHLGHLAGHPLRDPRVEVRVSDVGAVIRGASGAYDAILLDVDNGPEGLTRAGNDALYGRAGLAAAYAALRPGGVLAVWSARPDEAFARRLRAAGFRVDEAVARAQSGRKGPRHTIWLATRR
jgi:spermidine synthase